MRTARVGLQAFVVSFFAIAFAQAQPAVVAESASLPKGWVKAASLRPGEPLSVQVRFARAPTLCTLVWIDNTALACDAEAVTGSSARLVFPAAQVYSIARDRTQDCEEKGDFGKRFLLGAGIGGALGGLIFSQSSGRAAAVGAMLGAGFGGGMAVGPQGLGAPVRPSMSFRFPMRRPGRRVP